MKPSKDMTAALDAAQTFDAVAANIRFLLMKSGDPAAAASIAQLAGAGEWKELVNRFWRTLAFGTGGLRGRTIGGAVAAVERGRAKDGARPALPCAGTNAMNYFNISRAVQGLAAYCHAWFRKQKLPGRPMILIAHDTRYFSPEFAELCAKIARELGCDAGLFDGPRSTPELSFAVRHMNATAGIVITASHNPPHDNGFKCYFSDGAQIVDAHAKGIVEKVNAVASDTYKALPRAKQGRLIKLGRAIDDTYMARLGTLILDPATVKAASRLKVVFSSIHGTGGVISKPMLKRLGFRFTVVAEQDRFDGGFPTVTSPNPEDPRALKLALKLADREHADVVIATDPDCDRMGVAIRNASGKMQLLSGNQIGSLIAAYRVRTLIAQGVITNENAKRCAIIKTLVTTDLQKAIARKHGLLCVETLTGFKYIGKKLGQYEQKLGIPTAEYRRMSEEKTRTLRLARSVYYVAGGEESYGYSAHDFVRDKDGNAAVVLFAEVCAAAKARGLTVDAMLDELYAEYGYYLERNETLTFTGADGAGKITSIAKSFAKNPPAKIAGIRVAGTQDFSRKTYFDSEGEKLPNENMTIFHLTDGSRVAVRPSGTEPKIKFYLFAKREAGASRMTPGELKAAKRDAEHTLASLWLWLEKDAKARAV